MKKNRGKLDDTLAACFSNIEYRKDYLFYAHMLGQCSIKIRSGFDAPAGVAFKIDHYNLYIDPNDVWVPFDNIELLVPRSEVPLEYFSIVDGVEMYRTMKGFDSFTLIERLSILKHEMLHILYGHVQRTEDRVHKDWNFATDCASNQQIEASHLPSCAILPESLSKKIGVKVPKNESSEFYYELIKDNKKEKEKEKEKESGSGNGQQYPGDPSHTTWQECHGDEDLQKDLTKKMIDRAQNETIKSKGSVPNGISEWLSLHSRKSEVNWKRVLRGITGNKRVGKRSTIMRNDRRFPQRIDLRGKTKDRTFNLLTISDVSGSMSDKAVISTLGEVKHVCDMTKADVDLIQIDTQAYKPEKLSKSTKLVQRKGNGGTQLYPAVEMAKLHKIDYQAIVVLTDGGVGKSDVYQFQQLNIKVIWLIDSEGEVLDCMNQGKMKAFKLTGVE
jgi:predicted metal-dependent peptidase